MEQNNHTYPKFEEGQVLTSKAMNSYFGYVDEQERLTRAQLLGVGIINGLEFNYKDNAITITKGTAVTADGYLIELPKDTTYTLAYEYDKNSDMLAKRNPLKETDDEEFNKMLSHIKYVLYENESDASKHNQNLSKSTNIPEDLSKYIISLMVDFVSQDTITQCNELSCDIVQSNFQIEIRPVLINQKDYNELATLLINFRFFNTYGSISNNLIINSTKITSLNNSIKTEFNSLKAFIKQHLALFEDHIKEEIIITHQGTFHETPQGTQGTLPGGRIKIYQGTTLRTLQERRILLFQETTLGTRQETFSKTYQGTLQETHPEILQESLQERRIKIYQGTLQGTHLGTLQGTHLGTLQGSHIGSLIELLQETHQEIPLGSLLEPIQGSHIGPIQGSHQGSHQGSLLEPIQGSHIGPIQGSHQGSLLEPIQGSHIGPIQEILSETNSGQPLLIMLNPTWILLLGNPADFLDRISNFSNKIEQLGEGMDSIPDYYILHLQNIILAMEEFVTYYNMFVGKYEMLPISKATNSRLVMLGNGSNSFHNLYRQYHDRIINSKQFSDDCLLLQKFLFRILLLSENFIDDHTKIQTIQCSRRKPHAKLGECYIPNYYKFNEDLVRIWNAHSLFDVSHFDEKTSYDLLFKPNSGYPRTIERTDFLVVEGYYGQNVDTVKSKIEEYIQENDLPIIVEAIECTTNTGGGGGDGIGGIETHPKPDYPIGKDTRPIKVKPELIPKDEIRDFIEDCFGKDHLTDYDTIIGREALDKVTLLLNNYRGLNQTSIITKSSIISKERGTTTSEITQERGNDLTLTEEDYNDLETVRQMLTSLLDQPQINQMIGCCTYDGKLKLIHLNKQVLLCVGSTKN